MAATNFGSHNDYSIMERETIKPEPVLLATTNAAALCGVTPKTWRTWATLGLTPAPQRIGRNLFWHREDLLTWLASGCPRR